MEIRHFLGILTVAATSLAAESAQNGAADASGAATAMNDASRLLGLAFQLGWAQGFEDGFCWDRVEPEEMVSVTRRRNDEQSCEALRDSLQLIRREGPESGLHGDGLVRFALLSRLEQYATDRCGVDVSDAFDDLRQ